MHSVSFMTCSRPTNIGQGKVQQPFKCAVFFFTIFLCIYIYHFQYLVNCALLCMSCFSTLRFDVIHMTLIIRHVFAKQYCYKVTTSSKYVSSLFGGTVVNSILSFLFRLNRVLKEYKLYFYDSFGFIYQ